MTQSFTHIFDEFVQRYIDGSTQENKGLITYYDAAWPSACSDNTKGDKSDGDECTWRPIKNPQQVSMANLASALEVKIPAVFETLFGRYFSLDLNAQHARGPVTLLQIWNTEDYDRLQKNLIAHVLMKRRLKQPETLFFALTDQDDLVISLDINTQAVVLEPVGKVAKEVLSDTLESFIASLEPVPQLVSL